MGDYSFAAGYIVNADSRPQAWITTAHVATGSLVLVTSLLLALRSARLAWRSSRRAVGTRVGAGGRAMSTLVSIDNTSRSLAGPARPTTSS